MVISENKFGTVGGHKRNGNILKESAVVGSENKNGASEYKQMSMGEGKLESISEIQWSTPPADNNNSKDTYRNTLYGVYNTTSKAKGIPPPKHNNLTV